MPQRSRLPLSLALEPAGAEPLYRQLYGALKQAILDGQLPPGTPLPSTRVLAAEHRLSRNTVLAAFEQLEAEGYIQSFPRAATCVACLPAPEEAPRPASRTPRSPSRRGLELLGRADRLAQQGRPPLRAFAVGQPSLEDFPRELWARLLARQARRLDHAGPFSPLGYGPLREAIAEYLATGRGLRCSAEQVVVTAGSQHALTLAARVLLDVGQQAWVEEPGYVGAHRAFAGAEVEMVPVPVDGEGLAVQAGRRLAPQARLAYVTPSHQFPLGMTLSLGRRLELLRWASEADAWVLEDDYDSEFRYAGRPLASLASLDREGRVIYVGTFSKVMLPGLRLGYVVVPPDLVEAFAAALVSSVGYAPRLEQMALAEFITQGHFFRHLRRMRQLYARRQECLLELAEKHLRGLLELVPRESGMHLVGWLPPGLDDRTARRRALAEGVSLEALSDFALAPLSRKALLLGYAAAGEAQLREGVLRLAQVLRELL
ncbi:PLP-dependent aminotransferase family protein [Calidithermus chliarophilus]|uniref:MocR-like pyridoxine biosynthesis transcription factor PdxR n=1 Tax=Calidithermus chliarophilus TaxID=52023 RepID=UPI000405E2FE|nr:PLP-dependent aminotransferase family protein [Calidithermus chliarophilus]